jgi:hypothetical protein
MLLVIFLSLAAAVVVAQTAVVQVEAEQVACLQVHLQLLQEQRIQLLLALAALLALLDHQTVVMA